MTTVICFGCKKDVWEYEFINVKDEGVKPVCKTCREEGFNRRLNQFVD